MANGFLDVLHSYRAATETGDPFDVDSAIVAVVERVAVAERVKLAGTKR